MIGTMAILARWGNRLLLAANLVLFAWILSIIARQDVSPGNSGIVYQDLISILLTALGVILAIVTLFIAGLAIWGYSALRNGAERIANDVAVSTATRVATDVARATAAREATSVDTLAVDPDEAINTMLFGDPTNEK